MHSRSSLSRHGAVMALCAIGLFAEPALAQGQQGPPSTKGFSVGTQMTLASRQAVDGPLNGQPGGADGATRIGGGASVAYGITEWLTLYMNGDGAEAEEDRVLAFGDIGARIFPTRGQRLRPYLDLAFTGRKAEFDAGTQTIDARGAGWSFGGGALYFLTSSLALDASVTQSVGGLDQFRDGTRAKNLEAIDVNSTRVSIGIRWYPGR